jgi:clan AA aspartic protease
MIRGTVTKDLDAWVDLAIASDTHPTIRFSAVVDTGFNGFLTLFRAVLKRFQARPLTVVIVTLADGSKTSAALFDLTVLWDGQPLTIEVDAAETEPLIGMALLSGHDLQMRVIPDGEVTIRAIPEGQ